MMAHQWDHISAPISMLSLLLLTFAAVMRLLDVVAGRRSNKGGRRRPFRWQWSHGAGRRPLAAYEVVNATIMQQDNVCLLAKIDCFGYQLGARSSWITQAHRAAMPATRAALLLGFGPFPPQRPLTVGSTVLAINEKASQDERSAIVICGSVVQRDAIERQHRLPLHQENRLVPGIDAALVIVLPDGDTAVKKLALLGVLAHAAIGNRKAVQS